MSKIKLASHNSMTYLAPRKWWMRLFNFLAKCQDKTIEEQYDAGVRLFDIRVRFLENGRTVFAHGLAEYYFPVSIYTMLEHWDRVFPEISVRLVLECSKRDSIQERIFKELCECAQKWYPNITLYGGHTKADWSLIYDFRNGQPEIFEHYQSFHEGKAYAAWWPRLWNFVSKHFIFGDMTEQAKAAGSDYLMIDFV